jgi:FixJ family two-component response regulator
MNCTAQTVFIVDDTAEVRTGLARLLSAADYQVCAYESAESFLRDNDAEAPGCLLLDVCLPGLTGPELQRVLAGSRFPRPIIFLTGVGDIETSVHAMKLGAIDFLTKPVESASLFGAVDLAFEHDSEQRRERWIRNTIRERLDVLTPRERQVMAQVIRGRLNKQIAADLGTGEKTVKVHRARVMSKMMVRSVAELVQLGARVGVSMEPTQGANTASFNWRAAPQPAFD